jgi:hypothetical protein
LTTLETTTNSGSNHYRNPLSIQQIATGEYKSDETTSTKQFFDISNEKGNFDLQMRMGIKSYLRSINLHGNKLTMFKELG